MDQPTAPVTLSRLVEVSTGPLLLLCDGSGELIYDGRILSEDAAYQRCSLSRRIQHVARWCRRNDRSFSFLHCWPAEDAPGTARARKIAVDAFRNQRLTVAVAAPQTLDESGFHTGMMSELLTAISDSLVITEATRVRGDVESNRILYTNRGFTSMFGYDAKASIGRSPFSLLAGADTDRGALATLCNAAEDFSPCNVKIAQYRADGDKVACETRLAPIRDATGWWSFLVLFHRDIGQAWRTEEQLRTQRLVMLTLGMGIWRLNLATQHLDWDEGMFDLYEVRPEEFHNSFDDWVATLSPEDRDRAPQILQEVLAKVDNELDATFSITTKGGKRKMIGVRAQRMSENADGSGEEVIYGINWDRTRELTMRSELDDSRSKLSRLERLAALGELAAGIGHEIRDPLELAVAHLESLSANAPDLAGLAELQSALDQIGSISEALRTYGHSPREPDFELVDMTDVVQHVLRLTEPLYSRAGITLRYEGQNAACLVRGQRVRLEQVLLNFLGNARDALKDSAERTITVALEKTADRVVMECRDSGPGIADEVRGKIFETSITTKGIGEGTGLGLLICKSIVDEHDGTIEASNDPTDGGARFVVSLPAAAAPSEGTRPTEASADADPDRIGIRTVMLVDDEQGIRMLLRKHLATLDVDVREAGTVDEAVTQLSSADHGIELVLCDLNLPDAPGTDIITRLAAQGVDVPGFLLLTGSSADEVDLHLAPVRDHVLATIKKPFRFAQLLPFLEGVRGS